MSILHSVLTIRPLLYLCQNTYTLTTPRMSKMSREEKLFRNEMNVLEHYREMASRDKTLEDANQALENLTNKYKALLEQARFLTWISGRLERRLHRSNRELNIKNNRLVTTLKELTKAEAGKNAYTIIYFIAIGLFVLEEFFVEPVINMIGESVLISILIKLVIVLGLKASEGFIERKVTKKQAFRDAIKDIV
jgi:hypothetical protein